MVAWPNKQLSGSLTKRNVKKSSSSSSKNSSSGKSSSSGGSSSSSSSSLYDRNTDYTAKLHEAERNGWTADQNYIQKLYDSWNAKVQDPEYSKYNTPSGHQQFEQYLQSPKTPQTQTNPWDSAITQSQLEYQDMLDRIEEQNRLAVQQGVNSLEANRGTLNQGYDETARQAYIAKMQAQKGLPQALAGQGITGGGTETAQLALDTSYGNNINQNEMARQNALSGLDQTISDVKTSGNLNLVEQQLALQQQQLSDYQNLYAQKIQQDNYLKQWQAQQDQQEMQNYMGTIGAYSDDYTAEINRLLAMGYQEDDYQIKALKAARAEKVATQQAAQAAAAQQNFENRMLYDKTQYQIDKPYYKSTSGGGGNGGLPDEQVKAIIGGATEDDSGQKAAYKPTLESITQTFDRVGFGARNALVETIMKMYQNGKITEAEARRRLAEIGV